MKPTLKNLFGLIASLKVTVAVLCLMAITFTLSTLIDAVLFSLRPRHSILYNIVNFFQLEDMSHSWWFITLLSLFSLNLLTCTLKRLPYTLKVLKPGKEPFREDSIEGKLLKKEWGWEDFKPESSEGLIKTITEHFKRPHIEHGTHGLNVFAEKGKYSHWGFYLAHLGILVMVMGGIFNAFGFQGYLKINKGEALDAFVLKIYPEKLFKKLGFSIRCDDYKKIHYDHSNKVKNYQSTLTILKEGEEVKTTTIDFSHPLKYQGVYIQQTLDGHVFDKDFREKVSIYVAYKRGLRKGKNYEVSIGDSFKVEETAHTIKITKFNPTYAVENRNGIRSRVPAVELMVFDGEKKLYQGWVSAGSPNKESEDYYFYLSPHIEENVTYTTLNISREPGEYLIWCGFIAMIVGFGISFFIPHRRIWLHVEERGEIRHVILAGATTKNVRSFEKDFRRLCQDLGRQYHLYDT